MNFAPTQGGTFHPSTLVRLAETKPAIVAPATDVVSPLELLIGLNDRAVSVTTARIRSTFLLNVDEPIACFGFDDWFSKTVAAISSYAGLKDGWDGNDAVAP